MNQLLLSILISCCSIVSCAQKKGNEKFPIYPGSTKAEKNEAIAYFGQGCFWHTEIVFQSLEGVRDAVSGYSGGSMQNPDYTDVCSGKTGHAEVVKVIYNPEKISYNTLLYAFFESHDPTQLNRQGNDIGTQYRSIVLYTDEAEKKAAEELIKKLTAEKKYKHKIVTEIKSFEHFYEAENYHQEYILHNRENSYVNAVSIPDYNTFRASFKGNFKK